MQREPRLTIDLAARPRKTDVSCEQGIGGRKNRTQQQGPPNDSPIAQNPNAAIARIVNGITTINNVATETQDRRDAWRSIVKPAEKTATTIASSRDLC